MSKRIAVRRLLFAAVLALMMNIFILSSQDADLSTKTSGSFIEKIAVVFVADFNEMTALQQGQIVASMQTFVRKAAHFGVYGLLGCLLAGATLTYKKMKFLKRLLAAGTVCILYAVSDEIHQLFVPGRSCQFKDMMIDSLGALLGILAVLITDAAVICRVHKKKKDTV